MRGRRHDASARTNAQWPHEDAQEASPASAILYKIKHIAYHFASSSLLSTVYGMWRTWPRLRQDLHGAHYPAFASMQALHTMVQRDHQCRSPLRDPRMRVLQSCCQLQRRLLRAQNLGRVHAPSDLLDFVQGVVVCADSGIVDCGESHNHGVPDAALHERHMSTKHHLLAQVIKFGALVLQCHGAA